MHCNVRLQPIRQSKLRASAHLRARYCTRAACEGRSLTSAHRHWHALSTSCEGRKRKGRGGQHCSGLVHTSSTNGH